jgi:hypothetical protein
MVWDLSPPHAAIFRALIIVLTNAKAIRDGLIMDDRLPEQKFCRL